MDLSFNDDQAFDHKNELVFVRFIYNGIYQAHWRRGTTDRYFIIIRFTRSEESSKMLSGNKKY